MVSEAALMVPESCLVAPKPLLAFADKHTTRHFNLDVQTQKTIQGSKRFFLDFMSKAGA